MAARAAPEKGRQVGPVPTSGGNRPQYISQSPSRDRPLRTAPTATLEHKRKAPRSAGNPWSSPAGGRGHGLPGTGALAGLRRRRWVTPSAGSPRHRQSAGVPYEDATSAEPLLWSSTGSPPSQGESRKRRVPTRPAAGPPKPVGSRRDKHGTSTCFMVGHPAPDVNLGAGGDGEVVVRRICDGVVGRNVTRASGSGKASHY